jgi:hypothetical protein
VEEGRGCRDAAGWLGESRLRSEPWLGSRRKRQREVGEDGTAGRLVEAFGGTGPVRYGDRLRSVAGDLVVVGSGEERECRLSRGTLILLNQVDRHQSSVVTGSTATAPIKASSATFGLPNLRVPKNHYKSSTPAALPASLPSSTNLPPRQFPPGSSSSSITRIPDGPRRSSVHILHAFRIREQVSEKDVCDLFSKDGTASSRILSLYSSALRSPH